MVRTSDSQWRSHNCPGFDPSILGHWGIWERKMKKFWIKKTKDTALWVAVLAGVGISLLISFESLAGVALIKKKNHIFLIHKEIQSGAVAMQVIYGEGLPNIWENKKKCANISPYMRRPLFIYDFATAPLWISLYIRKIFFSFLSVWDLFSAVSLNHYLALDINLHCTENSKQIFPEMKLRSLIPNFCISICERFIYSLDRSAYFAVLRWRTDRRNV